MRERYDIALYFIAGNSPVTWIPRLSGAKTLLNVDGLDWKREKWPTFAKKYIQFAEYLATVCPNVYVTDSTVVQRYYQDRYGSTPPYIAYGSDIELTPPSKTLARLGLKKDGYVLFVGRLVPENCAHHLVRAFRALRTDLKCVIVGGAAYAKEYIASLKAAAGDDPRIIFTGFVFGEGYQELGTNARIFVETSGVGGTHPALLEAMAFGNCVVAYDTEENLETIGDSGFTYSGKVGAPDLTRVLAKLLNDPDLVTEYGRRAQRRAQTVYTWTDVTDEYERLFHQLLDVPPPERLRTIDSQKNPLGSSLGSRLV